MMKFVVLVLAAVALTANGKPNNDLRWKNLSKWIDPVIHGGETAEKGEFPHMVQIQSSGGSHYCGSSVIGESHVLTAAHCVTGSPSSIKLVAGQYKLSEDDGTEQERDVEEIIIHPKYGSAGFDFDIAVLVLKEKLDLSTESVQAIALWDKETPLGPAQVSGWGDDENSQTPDTLKKLDLTIYDDQVCEDAYGSDTYTENMVCATGDFENGGQCVCFGDSGSPAFIVEDGTRYQVGIVSWGRPCANAGYPAAYAEVGKFIDFVREHVPDVKVHH